MTPTDTSMTNDRIDTLTGTGTGSRTSAVKDKVSQVTSHVKSTAGEFGRTAADNIDRNLDRTAGALKTAASSLRDRAGMGGGRMTDLARTTADKLDATATYFNEHHTREMMTDFESVVRRNPGASLMAALGVGFVIGMSMRKDRY